MVQLFLNLRTRVLILNIHIAMKCDVRGGKKGGYIVQPEGGGGYFNLKGGGIFISSLSNRETVLTKVPQKGKVI